MPGMNGRELFENAVQIMPELKVLYMSGYTDDLISHHGVLEEGINFLSKVINTIVAVRLSIIADRMKARIPTIHNSFFLFLVFLL